MDKKFNSRDWKWRDNIGVEGPEKSRFYYAILMTAVKEKSPPTKIAKETGLSVAFVKKFYTAHALNT